MSTRQEKDMEAIYGPLAKHSDHKIGETITFFDGEQPIFGRNRGKIIWIIGGTAILDLTYIVAPDIGHLPLPIAANEVIVQ